MFLNYMATKGIMENKICGMTLFKVGISIFFYVSYAILFANFFYWTYIHKRPNTKDLKETDTLTSKANGISKMSGHVRNGHTITNGIPKTSIVNGHDPFLESRYNLRSRKNSL